MLRIRPQQGETELPRIEAINAAAFAEHGGTASFDTIRKTRDDIISLVAEDADGIAGHILFSPVRLETPTGPVAGMGLGQLAVDPQRQREGIGTQLGEFGIQLLRERKVPYVIVIGHAAYYPRFGFELCSAHNIQCQWDGIPDATFMVMFPHTTAEIPRNALSGMAFFEGL